jgi:hypothetical protein
MDLLSGTPPASFPAPTRIGITLAPEDAFGVQGVLPRTTVPHGSTFRIRFHLGDGTPEFDALAYIDRLVASFDLADASATFDGNILTVAFRAKAFKDVEKAVFSLNMSLTPLLSMYLHLFTWIRAFDVRVGDAHYTVSTDGCAAPPIRAVTMDYVRSRIGAALSIWHSAGDSYGRLILAGYHYRHALLLQRLLYEGMSAVSEILLNLAKALSLVFETELHFPRICSLRKRIAAN